MAEVQYGQGVPDALPQTSAPDDYQNIRPTAAEGMQAFGAGASKAANFFGQVAADDSFNWYQDAATKLLHGDPHKIGPDGQPDTGYLGLKGRAALDARPMVEDQLDQLQKETLGKLKTPEQQAQFETYSRRYRAAAASQIGSYADSQATAWYGEVASASEKNALDRIANSPDDPNAVASGAADLAAARIRAAQIAGAQEGDPVYQQAVIGAKQDALQAQVLSIGAEDPERALRILQKNQKIAGTAYDNLYGTLRARANEQQALELGTGTAHQVTSEAAAAHAAAPGNPAQPVYADVASTVPGPYSAAGLARTVQIESGGKDVTNASGHAGYGQFSDSTWRDFGAGGSPHDLHDSVAAIQRYGAANAQGFQKVFGRQPTDAESYIMHQQGGGGGLALLTNPNANAARLVGADAITGNGGTTSMSAGQFVAMWTHKFNGTAPANGPMVSAASRAELAPTNPAAPQSVPVGGVPASPDAVEANPAPPAPTGQPAAAASPQDAKAAGYQRIMDSDASPEVKQKALAILNQQLQAMAIAADTTTAQRKQKSDQAADGIMTKILNGSSPNILPEIANNPDLTWETKESLTNAARAHAEDSATGATAAYGPGFWSAYKQVSAPAGDPSRIADVPTILNRARPGGDLSLAGAQKLISVMGQNSRSIDDQAVNTTKMGLMSYAKSKLSFDQTYADIPGMPPMKDPVGEKIFNAQFIPKFEASYDQWIKAGKDPWLFLNQDNVDKMITGMRPANQMAADRLAALSGESPDAAAATTQPAPPAPAGINPEAWQKVITAAPVAANGAKFPPQAWGTAIQMLLADPTPEMIKKFDASKFGQAGYDGAEILQQLTGKAAPAPLPAAGAPGTNGGW